MMERNWLIRTRNKKLLGPVSKSKIRDLLEKGSLTEDDELAMGNGYWFWVREKNLLEKYVYGDVPQGFNPVSEAANADFDLSEFKVPVAIPSTTPDSIIGNSEENIVYPEDDDLAYPDMGKPVQVETIDEQELLPSEDDLEYPDMDMTNENNQEEVEGFNDPPPPPPMVEEVADLEFSEDLQHEEEFEDIEEFEEAEDQEELDDVEAELKSRNKAGYIQQIKASQRKALGEDTTSTNIKVTSSNKKRNDRYLFIVIVILLVLIGFVLYLYYNLFNSSFPLVGISSAHAQTISSNESLSKKKACLS